ncbi:hypothetical protein C8J56DRAFT_886198 [Mycena floridula]|nr:hypothetical protein C8J56DRAFT_886198 [Mycena floridula]
MAWVNKSRDRYQGEGCENLWDCTAVQNEFDLSKGERCQHFHQTHREAQCAGARLYYETTLKERHQQKKIQSCSDDEDSVCRFYPSCEVSEVAEDLLTLEEEVENWKDFWGKDFWKPGKECWKSLHGILTETETESTMPSVSLYEPVSARQVSDESLGNGKKFIGEGQCGVGHE